MKKKPPILSACVFTLLFAVSMMLYYIFIRWMNETWYFQYFMFGMMLLVFGSMAVATVLAKGKKLPWYAKIPLSILAFAAIGCIPIGGYFYFDRNVFQQSNYHQLAVLMTAISGAIYLTLLFIYCKGRVLPKAKVEKIIYAAVMAVVLVGIILGAVGVPLYRPIYRLFTGTGMGGLEIPDTSMKYSFALTTEKYTQSSNLSERADIDIALAKNEWENFQLLLAAPKQDETVYVEVSDFLNASGETMEAAVYYAHYIYIPFRANMSDTHYYPDALIPLESTNAVTIAKGTNQSFFIETRSTADTPAGDYTATVTVKNSSGNAILQKEVKATVWDFTLPETHYSDTAMGMFCNTFFELAGDLENTGWGWNGRGYAEISADHEAVYKQYYDFLLAHGVSAYVLPYDILDERADAYMSDPRVTSFMIPYYEEDEMLVAAFQKVTANPDWAEKAYFYPIDEPHTKEQFDAYYAIVERLERLCPGYNMVTPFYTNSAPAGVELTPLALERDYNTILCPQMDLYSDAIYYLYYPGFEEEVTDALSQGKRSWWYVCVGPNASSGFCNMFTHLQGVQHRMLFWQQYDYDVTGFLYWDAASWDYAGNPWVNSKTYAAYNAAGDGLMLYPGRLMGVDGPVGSLRLKNVAAGLEDYDYLKLAEEAFGKEWVDETVARLTTSVSKYTKDCDLMEAVRREIGEKLSGQ